MSLSSLYLNLPCKSDSDEEFLRLFREHAARLENVERAKEKAEKIGYDKGYKAGRKDAEKNMFEGCLAAARYEANKASYAPYPEFG